MDYPLKEIIQSVMRSFIRRLRVEYWRRQFRGMGPEDIFTCIYLKNYWGGKKREFFSGNGSRDFNILNPYVNSVTDYLEKRSTSVNAVDIGCGDFYLGRHLVHLTDSYSACDIVKPLIENNKRLYQAKNLTFMVLNAIDDPLPEGNIVFIRQVFQHLGNEEIQKILAKLAQYEIWIVTEHLPSIGHFTPNIDKPTGPDIRLAYKSGVVLTEPPFNISPRTQSILCEVPASDGVIRTTVYEF
jgi:hypothetical protein